MLLSPRTDSRTRTTSHGYPESPAAAPDSGPGSTPATVATPPDSEPSRRQDRAHATGTSEPKRIRQQIVRAAAWVATVPSPAILSPPNRTRPPPHPAPTTRGCHRWPGHAHRGHPPAPPQKCPRAPPARPARAPTIAGINSQAKSRNPLIGRSARSTAAHAAVVLAAQPGHLRPDRVGRCPRSCRFQEVMAILLWPVSGGVAGGGQAVRAGNRN